MACSKPKGECDRCGFEYLLSDLKPQVLRGRATKLLVCDECMDIDWPIPKPVTADKQRVDNPRPPQETPWENNL